LLHNVTNLVTFSILLWQISNLIKLSFFGKALNIQGLLVYIALLYGILEVAFSLKIGRPLLSLNRKRETFEADYRYKLMRIDERREEMTLHSGEYMEGQSLRQAFENIRRNYLTCLKKEIYIASFKNVYGHLDQFIPIFLMGPSYFTGVISLGILMQVGQLFTQVSGSLGSIVRGIENIYHDIDSFQRLVSFEQQMIQEISPAKFYPQNTHYIEVQPFTLCNQKEVSWKVPLIRVQKGNEKFLWHLPAVVKARYYAL
jgi:putative ATP-binding cassette transporter